jgi:hypothetical protein
VRPSWRSPSSRRSTLGGASATSRRRGTRGSDSGDRPDRRRTLSDSSTTRSRSRTAADGDHRDEDDGGGARGRPPRPRHRSRGGEHSRATALGGRGRPRRGRPSSREGGARDRQGRVRAGRRGGVARLRPRARRSRPDPCAGVLRSASLRLTRAPLAPRDRPVREKRRTGAENGSYQRAVWRPA